ncbi:chemotaxis protein CheW [Longivirga aurantiaca]|uniref:Chemotaxis protein CheW n=1 Tax=Longivirga aurantiaca TaxID=1837743 RepID=A0ABW1SYC8_9ACTN
MSLFTAAPTPSAARRSAAPAPAPAAVEPGPRTPVSGDGGHVLFAVGATTFAVAVGDVHEITRAPRLDLLPEIDRPGYGLAVALVDVRGRSVPVVDLRTDRSCPGDVLLPVYRRHAGLVVDRVVRVTAAGELVPETDEVPETLPSWTRGIVRPAGGGDPVVVVAMPDAAAIETGGARAGEPPLGSPVLGAEA